MSENNQNDRKNIELETPETEPASESDQPEVSADSMTRESESTELEPDAVSTVGRAAPKEETVKDNFKPYYKKEARLGGLYKIIQYGLLALLGACVLIFGVEAFIQDAPYKTEAAATVVIAAALIGLLWKMTTIEARAGVAAAAMAFLFAEAHTVYGAPSLSIFGFPGSFFICDFSLILLVALLFTVWKTWPRLHWAPLTITVIVAYAGLGVIFPYIYRTEAFSDIVAGPAFFESIPVFIRPGWLLFQVVFPLGAILLLYRQFQVRFKPQFASHWGYVFWSVALIVMASAGLAVLERSNLPSFPPLASQIAAHYPRAAAYQASLVKEDVPVISAEKPEEDVTPAPEQAEVVKTAETAVPEDTAKPIEEKTADATGPEASTASEEAVATTPEPVVKEKPVETTPVPAAAAAPQPAIDPAEIEMLKQRVSALEREVDQLKLRLDVHDRLIRAMLEYFRVEVDKKPGAEPQVPPIPSEPAPEKIKPDTQPAPPAEPETPAKPEQAPITKPDQKEPEQPGSMLKPEERPASGEQPATPEETPVQPEPDQPGTPETAPQPEQDKPATQNYT